MRQSENALYLQQEELLPTTRRGRQIITVQETLCSFNYDTTTTTNYLNKLNFRPVVADALLRGITHSTSSLYEAMCDEVKQNQ